VLADFEMDASLLDEQRLAEVQLTRLNMAVARAREGRFYADKLVGAPARLESLAEARQLPITRKPEILADAQAHPPFGSRAHVTREELRMVVTTSGTSGVGQEVYALDAADEAAVFAMEARGFGWAGISNSSVVLNTLPMTTTAAGQWYYHGLRLLGATVMQVGGVDSQKTLAQLLWFQPDTVIATPSYLYRLARLLSERGLEPRLLGIKRLILAGEAWAGDWIRALGEKWGAKLFEQYGCTQRAIAWNCEFGAIRPDGSRGVLHTLPDHALYEVVDPASGEPTDPGEFGELYVTPFTANASPLIRFATGDRVQVAAACECGRPGIGLVSGRVNRFDNMLKVKGVNLWPDALDRAIFAVDGVGEYEATVVTGRDGREELVIVVETADPRSAERVAEAVHQMTGLHSLTRTVEVGALSAKVTSDFTKLVRLTDRRDGKERHVTELNT
jgi:phenylacetate-CoA ligase